MNRIPNLPPTASTASAVVVGYLLLDDLNAKEQNALGNWLMLAAQVICTNAYFRQLYDSESPSQSSSEKDDENIEIAILTKMVKALNKEIEILKAKVQ